MKRLLLPLMVLALLCGVSAAAEQPAPSKGADDDRLPGVALAEGISQVTGVAVSPLLGTSAIGAWRYYRTPANLRDRLPWFCHPGVWGFCFALLALCFVKDTLGTATPAVLKKPLDLLELFENKLSGIIASAAIVPLIATQVAKAFADAPVAAPSVSADVHYGSMLPQALGFLDARLLFMPFALFAFAVVWMTSHAVNVLILLSPFGFLDALLKLLRTALLSGLAAACLINPFLGAAISLLIIALAAWLAPKAFRFTIFGMLVAADILLPARGRRMATPNAPHVFSSRRIGAIPANTYGRLTRTDDGGIQFTYRPWLILGRRTVALSPEPITVERGLLYPSLLQASAPSGRLAALFSFLPRYCGQEESLAEALAATNIREHTLARGYQAVKAWVLETFGSNRGSLAVLTQSSAA